MVLSKYLDKFLVDTYPILYRDRYNMERGNRTLMTKGFQIRDGWFSLLNEASFFLEREIHALREIGEEEAVSALPRAFEVVSEGGTLKIRILGITRPMQVIVQRAEDASRTVCEECGSPGKIRSGFVEEFPIVATLCTNHNFLE